MSRRGSLDTPGEHSQPEDLGVDEILAADRTALSNERTLLAYIRTALTFAVSGASAIQFIGGGGIVEAIGYMLVAAGVITGLIGGLRFRSVRARVADIEQDSRSARSSRKADDDEED